ncbi:unnamed protein product, partial [Mycena citricolor]
MNHTPSSTHRSNSSLVCDLRTKKRRGKCFSKKLDVVEASEAALGESASPMPSRAAMRLLIHCRCRPTPRCPPTPVQRSSLSVRTRQTNGGPRVQSGPKCLPLHCLIASFNTPWSGFCAAMNVCRSCSSACLGTLPIHIAHWDRSAGAAGW